MIHTVNKVLLPPGGKIVEVAAKCLLEEVARFGA